MNSSIQASLAQHWSQLENKRQPEPPPPSRAVVKPRKKVLKTKKRVTFQDEDEEPKLTKVMFGGGELQAEVKRVMFGVENPKSETKRAVFLNEAPQSKDPHTCYQKTIAQHWNQLQEETREGPKKLQNSIVDESLKSIKAETHKTIDLGNNDGDSLKEKSGMKETDAIEYPTSLKLIVIVLAVSLAVFCTGLVSTFYHHYFPIINDLQKQIQDRTIIPAVISKSTDDYKTMQDVG